MAHRHILRMLRAAVGDESTTTFEEVDDDSITFSCKISDTRIEDVLMLQICAGEMGYVITDYDYFPEPLQHRDTASQLIQLKRTQRRHAAK